MSDSLQPHGLQHAGLPCPSLSPRVCSNSSHPLHWWCHPTISSSVAFFSFCFQSFPASGSFPVSQFLASVGQSIEASSSASVLSMTIHSWFPLGLTCLISLLSKGLSRVFSSTTVWKHQFFSAQLSLWSISHIHTWLLEKPQLWLDRPFSQSDVSTFPLSSFVIASFPRSNCLLISWLQPQSAVILEPEKRKSVSASTFPPSICHEVMGPDAMILAFWMSSFKPILSLLIHLYSSPEITLLYQSSLWANHATTWEVFSSCLKPTGINPFS